MNVKPKIGDLRVWWNRFDKDRNQYFSVPSVEIACGVLFGMSIADLANPNIQSNVGGLEVFEDIQDGNGPTWNEWYDDDMGHDVWEYTNEHFPNMERMKKD